MTTLDASVARVSEKERQLRQKLSELEHQVEGAGGGALDVMDVSIGGGAAASDGFAAADDEECRADRQNEEALKFQVRALGVRNWEVGIVFFCVQVLCIGE